MVATSASAQDVGAQLLRDAALCASGLVHDVGARDLTGRMHRLAARTKSPLAAVASLGCGIYTVVGSVGIPTVSRIVPDEVCAEIAHLRKIAANDTHAPHDCPHWTEWLRGMRVGACSTVALRGPDDILVGLLWVADRRARPDYDCEMLDALADEGADIIAEARQAMRASGAVIEVIGELEKLVRRAVLLGDDALVASVDRLLRRVESFSDPD